MVARTAQTVVTLCSKGAERAERKPPPHTTPRRIENSMVRHAENSITLANSFACNQFDQRRPDPRLNSWSSCDCQRTEDIADDREIAIVGVTR